MNMNEVQKKTAYEFGNRYLGPFLTAFAYWLRCSEFSADRASAVFCGGPERVIDVMLRMAGGSQKIASEINADLFMQQADEYADCETDRAAEFKFFSAVHECFSLQFFDLDIM